ncbi:MAG: phosphatase PAP2 family protein [Bacteroidaceae bacterium]|nr:phosphatase PAP2 family protein [Bacteroidaceae bacterium]MBQ8270569.1 phosphatase PAP2 family protein [Bacteroidaceae bacterium]
MRYNILILSIISLFVANRPLAAQRRDAVKTSTDLLMFASAAVGAGVALIKSDNKGVLQLVEGCATSVAAAYLLKYTVSKRRPDGSDNNSFPSNHTGVAFAGATFLYKRYGWQWGVPAYLVAAYVGWGRIYSERHDAWDVLAGAAIGTGSALLFTKSFSKQHEVVVAPLISPEVDCGIHFSMRF